MSRGLSLRDTAKVVQRSPSTLSVELRKYGYTTSKHEADSNQEKAQSVRSESFVSEKKVNPPAAAYPLDSHTRSNNPERLHSRSFKWGEGSKSLVSPREAAISSEITEIDGIPLEQFKDLTVGVWTSRDESSKCIFDIFSRFSPKEGDFYHMGSLRPENRLNPEPGYGGTGTIAFCRCRGIILKASSSVRENVSAELLGLLPLM